jgi:hypothetical protein
MKILLIEDSKFQRLGTLFSMQPMVRRVSVLPARTVLILFCST